MRKPREFQAAPKLTAELGAQLEHVAHVFKEKPAILTKAMQDPHTRREMATLVADLASLVEVIEGGD